MHGIWTALILLLLSLSAYPASKKCKTPVPWPTGHEPLTVREFNAHLETIFRAMLNDTLTGDEELGRAATSTGTADGNPPTPLTEPVTLQRYLRELNVGVQRIFLEEVAEIERIPDLQERRRRAYDAWHSNRIAASALAVFLRTVTYDRDFRTTLYAAHGEATRDLAKHLMFLAWLQKLLDEAKDAVEHGRTVPKTHPLHTLDLAQLKVRIDWISQTLLEQMAHKYGWIAKVGATDYAHELSRYHLIRSRHRVAMDRLWKVLQNSTWGYSRWLFRASTELEVLRNRYANATFATKVFLPSVVVMGTALAVFGNWAGLKEFLLRLLQ